MTDLDIFMVYTSCKYKLQSFCANLPILGAIKKVQRIYNDLENRSHVINFSVDVFAKFLIIMPTMDDIFDKFLSPLKQYLSLFIIETSKETKKRLTHLKSGSKNST